ncbi:MAG: enoyl-CoA hydratase/isomerase family protein [Mycobacterium sp.]|nr:enoyl-CoA hydratase/isomerase family protein [Mycobacterium sp.]
MELTTLEDKIACVTLNRPSRLNAIDGSLMDAMDDALDALGTGEYRAAILTGAGRGFCAGADLSGTGEAWTKSTPQSPLFKVSSAAQVRLAELYLRLYELPIPVIAAVNGVAVGGGLAFALHCDIRIASQQARFGSVFIKAGFSSMDMGTSYLLPKIVGAGVARELMLTGRIIDADEALRIGLVGRVVPHEELMPTARALAHTIAANPPLAVRALKCGLRQALDPDWADLGAWVSTTLGGLFQTADHREGVKAFLEKRAPHYTGQ